VNKAGHVVSEGIAVH